jgi:chaperonin GroES
MPTSQMNEGVIMAVGPGRRDKDGQLIPMGVKEGDKVLLPEYGGSLVKLNDKELFLYRDEEILGLLK